MWRHYVYQHRRKDTGAVFYIGKGSVRARCKNVNYERAYCFTSRNKWWQNIAKKHGIEVEIVAMFSTDADSQWYEKELIKELGRTTLVNMTDGGDGHYGIVVSDELREKRRISSSGKRSEKWISAIRKARKNGGNGGVVKLGDKLPAAWVESLSRSKLGAKNPWYGRPTPVAKPVMNVFTGKVYQIVAEAAKDAGMKAGKLYSILDGHTKVNRTELVRI